MYSLTRNAELRGWNVLKMKLVLQYMDNAKYMETCNQQIDSENNITKCIKRAIILFTIQRQNLTFFNWNWHFLTKTTDRIQIISNWTKVKIVFRKTFKSSTIRKHDSYEYKKEDRYQTDQKVTAPRQFPEVHLVIHCISK